ncbi:Protein kinase superfamily protein [Hirschfeldia incana]|nr:Protein kinase superfamily protein [Hirschfeldia incana]
MRKFFCCHQGESSSGAREAEDQTQPLQPPSQQVGNPHASSSLSIIDENESIFDENLFDDNEGLNLAWRNLWKSYEEAKDASHDPYPGHKIKWSEILEGTLNFRSTNYLGQGNFGEVYRCDIPRLDKVGAAKVQKNQTEEAHAEFLAEITTLHAANHPNMISLLGKCFRQDHRVIVYEFMPRGSLDHHLFPSTRPSRAQGRGILQEYKALSWSRRLRIAVGVAKGLVYLHEELKMVHRDVKVSNVLLDEKFVPKLTDFGLASVIVEDENGVEKRSEITLIKGTPGCTAPETEELGLVSSKNDVYSYGVFLFVLFTGKKAFDSNRSSGRERLTDWLRAVCSRGDNIPLVVDSAMGNRFPEEGLIKLFETALMCVDPQLLARPEMRFVESMVSDVAVYEVPSCSTLTRRHSI